MCRRDGLRGFFDFGEVQNKKIMYKFFCLLLLVLYFSPVLAVLDIQEEALIRDLPELLIVRNIADNIMRIRRGSRSQLEMGLDDVMNDHVQDYHGLGDTYFRTNRREDVRALINLVVSNPTRYNIHTIRDRNNRPHYRLIIRKTIDRADVQRIIGHDNLGKDSRNDAYLNHIIVVLSIDGVNSLEDSLTKGNFLTAFPSREDFMPH